MQTNDNKQYPALNYNIRDKGRNFYYTTFLQGRHGDYTTWQQLPFKQLFYHTSQTSFCPILQWCHSTNQDFNNGSHVKKNYPMFNNEHGIEALFYVKERFNKVAKCNFQWAGNGANMFANFEEVLVDMVLTNWEDIIDPIDNADKTDECFEEEMQQMYHKYVGAEARDTQLEYFKTLCKPMELDPLTHSSCMLTLERYINKLLGTEPPLMEIQVNKCIFQSFLQTWQQQFIRTGQHVATTQLSDIIEFMSNKKSFTDAKAPQKDKKKYPEAGNGGDGSHKKRK
jgi:hypothetical protein